MYVGMKVLSQQNTPAIFTSTEGRSLIVCYGRPPATAGRRPLCFTAVVSIFLFFLFLPPNLRGHLADHHQTLPHGRRWPRFIKFGQTFGGSSPQIWRPQNIKFRRDFGQLRDLIANISGTQQDIVSQKTALQTTDTPAQAHLIWCTLVHKQRK